MIELQRINRWWGRRSRYVIAVSLASASLLATDVAPAQAGWSPFSALRKPADGGGAKSSKGFNTTIRNLLNDAKAQEEQGHLDRAIVLADRATSVSEAAAKIVKPAPDLSPEVTARYANDLRLKKAAQSVPRAKAGGAIEQAQQAGRSKQEASVAAKSAEPIEPAPIARRKEHPLDFGFEEPELPQKAAAKPPAAPESQVAKRSVSANSDVALKRRSEPADELIEFDLPVVKQPAPPAALPSDSYGEATAADNIPVNEGPPRRSLRPGQTAVAELEADSEFGFFEEPEPKNKVASVPATAPDESVVADNSTGFHQSEASNTTEPIAPRMKLRPRFDIEDPFEMSSTEFEPFDGGLQESDSEDLTADTNSGPTITPMESLPSHSQLVDSEREQILPVAADDQSKAELAQAHRKSSSSMSDESAEEPWFEEADDRFPISKVRELQKRLDTAAALKPGEIPTVLTANMQSDSGSENHKTAEVVNGVRVVRLRKRRHTFRDVPANGPRSIAVDEVQQPSIDITQMVTWRSAKPAGMDSTSESKGGSLPDDLRQALRDTSSELSVPSSGIIKETSWHQDHSTTSGSTVSESTASTRRPVRGSLWNNASVPPMEGFSGAIGGSSEHVESTGALTLAPPPPVSEVEQTSFDASEDWARRRDRAKDDSWSSAGDSTSTSGIRRKSSVDASAKPSKNRAGRTDEQSASTRAILTKGPIERFAFLFGVTTSTASSILGAGGFALLIAGLWMVRAVVRAGKS